MIWSRRSTSRDRAAGYAPAVVAALTREFLDLADDHLAGIVREAVTAHALAPDPAFEVILDAPAMANWRQRAHPTERRRLRVACHRFTLLGAVMVTR
ncbi:hypothetical protein AB0C84_44510 [Actinomadura sp. NPDC048955]|uniref:hypothetical protein n=1 Tax=Actinomadura sp. NPDC048955 TaxID=3158228 RepID=UPI0033D0EF17